MFIWLYKTSGFYDKTIDIKNLTGKTIYKILDSNVYNRYFNTLLNACKTYTGDILFCFHGMHEVLKPYKENFYKYIEKKSSIQIPNLFDIIKEKNVVIINNLGVLMKQQYESGNAQKIF